MHCQPFRGRCTLRSAPVFSFFEEGLWCLDAATFPETVLRVESQQWDCYSGWETLPARSLGTSLATASLSTTIDQRTDVGWRNTCKSHQCIDDSRSQKREWDSLESRELEQERTYKSLSFSFTRVPVVDIRVFSHNLLQVLALFLWETILACFLAGLTPSPAPGWVHNFGPSHHCWTWLCTT